jgi:hypothetical protein
MAIKRTVKKTVKKKSKKVAGKKFQRGTVGNFFVFGVLALLMVLGITAVGGLPSQMAPTSGQVVSIVTPTPGSAHDNLQLKWFGYVTIAPTPTPPKASLCNNRAVNTEPIILTAYFPGQGQTVGNGPNDYVKVWVNDERPPFISPGELFDLTTGVVTTPGNRTAKADDNYLYEPALYISPATAETGGTAHFPDIIKGQVNNNPSNSAFLKPQVVNGPHWDPLPAGSNGVGGPNPNGSAPNDYVAEYLWKVSNLGLTAGTYQAEFVIHDGDFDRGVGCVAITIQ